MKFNSDGLANPFEGRKEEVPEDPFANLEVDFDEPLQGDEPEAASEGSFKNLVRKGEAEYLPVLDPIILTPHIMELEGRGSGKIGGRKVGWWQDDAMISKHPYMLANPTMMASKKNDSMDNFRSTFEFPKGETFILMDSGGLQVSKFGNADLVFDEDLHNFKEGRLHPGRVVDWQNKYGDVGAIIDIGTFVTKEQRKNLSYQEWYDDIYEPALETTKKTSRIAQEYARDLDSEFELLGVVHGWVEANRDDPLESHKRWIKECTEEDEFYGWAFGSSAPNGAQFALSMMLVQELKDPDYMHVFGVALIDFAPIAQYVAEVTDTFVTADSTKHATGSRFRKFMMPYVQEDLILSTREGGAESGEHVLIDRMPCRCEVCRCVKDEEGHTFYTQGVSSRQAMAMQLHNLSMILQERDIVLGVMSNYDIEEIFDGLEISGTGDDRVIDRSSIKFWDILRNLKGDRKCIELYYTLRFVRDCDKMGVEDAFHEYDISKERFESGELAAKPIDHREALQGW